MRIAFSIKKNLPKKKKWTSTAPWIRKSSTIFIDWDVVIWYTFKWTKEMENNFKWKLFFIPLSVENVWEREIGMNEGNMSREFKVKTHKKTENNVASHSNMYPIIIFKKINIKIVVIINKGEGEKKKKQKKLLKIYLWRKRTNSILN